MVCFFIIYAEMSLSLLSLNVKFERWVTVDRTAAKIELSGKDKILYSKSQVIFSRGLGVNEVVSNQHKEFFGNHSHLLATSRPVLQLPPLPTPRYPNSCVDFSRI
jgi:hypothetical protein